MHLHDGQDRDHADNGRTKVVILNRMPRPSFEALFRATWPELRRIGMSFDKPGVAVAAVDVIRRRVAGSLCVAAKPGQANSAIIGRHSQCDLYLHSDPAMSLRHLAVLVHPRAAADGASGTDVVYRVVDLRTDTAFTDEHDRRLEAVTAEGPMFLACGNYALFFLVTGDPAAWPEDAAEAWACIPERVYVGEQEAEPDRWKRRRGGVGTGAGAGNAAPSDNHGSPAQRAQTSDERPAERATSSPSALAWPGNWPAAGMGRGGMAQGTNVESAAVVASRVLPAASVATPAPVRVPGTSRRDGITVVSVVRGPARPNVQLVGTDEQPLGALRLSAGGDAQTLVLGEQILDGGVLLGRYERCDTHGTSVIDVDGVSRVHILVIRIDGVIYAVDTASTNGTYLASGDEVRTARLSGGTALTLGEDLARLEWRSP
ncbi:MAG TPA: FHA domain-containing protein [Kofleriaceae bacterium]|nr:FHA domain-containing protein [Kofleriaceae bacterium]